MGENLYEEIMVFQVIVVFSFLLYASWSDIKSREVSNKVWALLGPIGLALSLIHIHLTKSYSMLDNLGLSFLITTVMAIALFYLGFFGGADAKALICLSLSLPYYPNNAFTPFFVLIPFLPVSVFINAVFSSVLVAFYALLRNMVWVGSGKSLFEGLESEPLSKKFMSLITGYKVKASDLENKSYLYPTEKIEETQEGEIKRSFQVFVSAEADREASVKKIMDFSKKGLVNEVWATPGLPFLVFITVGLVVTLLFGDLVFWLIFSIWKL